MLHHVELNVANLERSRAFWGWFLGLLGYTVGQQWDEGVSYHHGSTYLVFVQTKERFLDQAFHRRHTGLNHLAFHASSSEFVDRVREGLQQRGATLLYDERFPHAGGPHTYAVFFEDPDRLKVELVVTA